MLQYIPMIMSLIQGMKEDKKHKSAGQAPSGGMGGQDMSSIISSLGKGQGGDPGKSLAPTNAPSGLAQGDAMGLAQKDPWDNDAFGDAGY